MSAELSVELLTPEVVNNWERVAIQQLQSKREKISIPTTLLLAMVNKLQIMRLEMNMIERHGAYGIPLHYYTEEEMRLLMDDWTGRKTLDSDKWAEIVTQARKRLNNNEPVADIGDKK